MIDDHAHCGVTAQRLGRRVIRRAIAIGRRGFTSGGDDLPTAQAEET